MNLNTIRNNIGQIQAIDRENIGHVFQTPANKDTRKLAPKQVFGDIQNVIHNQQVRTPLKNVRQGVKPSPLARRRKEASRLKVKPIAGKFEDGFEHIWSEKSLFLWSDYEDMVEKGVVREKNLQAERWKQLEGELLAVHRGTDDFFGPLDEELTLPVYEDEIPTFKVPDVFVDSDFLDW